MTNGQVTYDNQTSPVWIKDYINREHNLPGGAALDAKAFRPGPVTITKDGAGTAGQTSIVVNALTTEIKDGDFIAFGAQVVVASADVAVGATTIPVKALTANIADDAAGVYIPPRAMVVKSATLVGRTYAEQATGAPFGPWAAGDAEVYLTIFDVQDLNHKAEVELLRPGTIVATNRIPGFASRPAPEIARIRELYTAITAA